MGWYNKLQGYKTYITAAATALLGVVDLLNGDMGNATTKFALAASAFGLRNAIG